MLIICTEKEKIQLEERCNSKCGECIFFTTSCPIARKMIIANDEIKNGKNVNMEL